MRAEGGSVKNKREEKKWGFRSTMITILCVLVVAIAGILFLRDSGTDEGEPFRMDAGQQNAPQSEWGVHVDNPVPTVDSKENPSGGRSGEGGDGNADRNAGTFLIPVKEGKITKEFSGNQLIYSKTLDQFETHTGMDFTADEDAQVLAAAAGTVIKVGSDDKFGLTIEIDHGNGYVTRYCNLSTDEMVEEGDTVEAGSVISGVGRDALFESLDPPHLHFEVIKNGEKIDPKTVLKTN